MAFNIDLDRGVMIRTAAAAGVEVYMYMDDPGHYLSAHGTEVSESLAAQAGFPVEELGKQRIMQERMADAMEKIRIEMNVGEQNRKVVRERQGFRLVDIGLGRHHIESPDGAILTDQPLPKAQAEKLLMGLTPKEPEPEPKSFIT